MTRIVAVTGAAGLVGRATLTELAQRGIAARAIVNPGGTPAPDGPHDVRAVDVRHADAVSDALAGTSAVIHLAVKFTGDHVQEVAVEGARNVLDAARKHGIGTMVHLSSNAVYGDGSFDGITEDRPIDPTGPYACGKAVAEGMIEEEATSTGLNAWIMRPCDVFGPGDKKFSALITGVARDGVLPLVGESDVRYDVVAAADVARACITAIDRHAPSPATRLHLTSGEALTVRELADRVRERFGLPTRTVRMERGGELPEGVPPFLAPLVTDHRRFSIQRARTLLDYSPSVRFPDGIVI